MTINEITASVIAGGLLGALGQGIRIAVGLKKLNEENSSQAAAGSPREPFSTSRLVISIFIGFVAGALALLTKQAARNGNSDQFDNEMIVTLIATGYAGADFIEGIFITHASKFNPPVTNPPATEQAQPNAVQTDIVG